MLPRVLFVAYILIGTMAAYVLDSHEMDKDGYAGWCYKHRWMARLTVYSVLVTGWPIVFICSTASFIMLLYDLRVPRQRNSE